MIAALVLPALAALVVGTVAAPPHRRLHPSAGARALAVVAASVALGAYAAATTLAVGFLSSVPWLSEHLSWCMRLARTHDDIPAVVGLPSVVAVAAMTGGLLRAGGRARQSMVPGRPTGELLVVDDGRPDAYAVPGRPGHIVVTAGMLRLLEPMEREVLLAHERSHLRHGHHRYLAVAALATAVVPVLGFVTRRLRLAVERWADEDAAAAVGDRELVARTIIRAALATRNLGAQPSLALGRVGVPARVEALLNPAPAPPFGPPSLAVGAGVAGLAIVAGSVLQVHHLFAFAAHVCGVG